MPHPVSETGACANSNVSPALRRIRRVIWRQGLPDCVPVEIGIGPWYACKLLGATTVDLVHGNPSPRECMLEAFRRYDYDPWLWASNSVWIDGRRASDDPEPAVREEVLCDTIDEHRVRYVAETPAGPVSWQTRTLQGQPTVQTEFPVKDVKRDWPRYRHVLGASREYPGKLTVDEALWGKGAGGPGACLPVAWWYSLREGGMASVAADLLEHSDLMGSIFSWYTRRCLDELQAIVRAENRGLMDAYFIQGSSSSLSLSSLYFFQTYDLPFLKAVTAVTHAANITSHLHVCGRSRAIVELCHDETQLDIMEPLERAPGGDCDLGEVKRRFGEKLVLKGNINTFNLLARGTTQQVSESVKRALDEAMPGGGFWLATGDQTPADAPEENLVTMIQTAREHGRY